MGQTLDIDYNHSYNTMSLNHNGNYETRYCTVGQPWTRRKNLVYSTVGQPKGRLLSNLVYCTVGQP